MVQNTSHAVMSQRHEAPDSLDFFPTPAFATRALCEWLKARNEPLHLATVWEPACGQGDMSRPLTEYFSETYSSDVHDYGFGSVLDFLWMGASPTVADWIITNPPFVAAEQFAKRAISEAREGVALLVRINFLESANRYKGLFQKTPPSDILQFVERVPMFKGRLDRHGSTARAYCWLIWRKGAESGTKFHWIAPCRKRLERDADYPSEAQQTEVRRNVTLPRVQLGEGKQP